MPIVYRGKVFDVIAEYTKMPNGKQVYREYVVHPGAVVIIPFISRKEVLLLKQYRPVISAWLYEFPAGTLEEGEKPLETAHRELEEETGYKASEMIELGTFFTSPGISTEKMHVFLARGLEKKEMRLEEDELIEVMIVDIDKTYDMILEGEIRDGKTIAALMFYLLRYKAGA